MKFCTTCGAELVDEAVICPKCGVAVPNTQQPAAPAQTSGLTTAAKVFMIIGTIVMGLTGYLVPLAWCIPMTVVYFKKLKNNQPIGTGFKVCCLLFVSLLAGVFMLCDKEH